MIGYAVMDFDKNIIIEDEPLVFDYLDEARDVCNQMDGTCVQKIQYIKGRKMKILNLDIVNKGC